MILRAILDLSELGRSHAEAIDDGNNDDRFNSIIRLLEIYRGNNSAFIEALYKFRPKAVSAVRKGAA